MIPIIVTLFIVGCIILIGSFLFRNATTEEKQVSNLNAGQYLEQVLQERLDQATYRIGNAAEESADYIKEQTAQELEKLSYKKINEVNEYSEHVMEQINKNHNEVMFLYSMLNDKQKELDKTVESLNRAQFELKKHSFEVQHLEKEAKRHAWEGSVEEQISHESARTQETDVMEFEISNEKYDKRQRILELAESGKTELEIAKQLSMGIGEVRLVLGLSKGVK